MAISQGSAFSKRLIDAYSRGHLNDFDELLADDVVLFRDGEKARGIAEFKAVLGRLQQAFPDIRYRIDDVIESQGRIVLRWEASGTQQGEYLGVPPSGRKVSYTGVTVYELRDGKVARLFVAADLLSLLRHLREARSEAAAEAYV